MNSDTQLCLDGEWRPGRGGRAPVLNPANEKAIGSHAIAYQANLDDALAAAARGFEKWHRTSAFKRAKFMRRATELLRERNDSVARAMTMEQGKPIAESRLEAAAGADVINWFAEKGQRAYGRLIPARAPNVAQLVVKEPVGPVAAFSPWNFCSRGRVLDHPQGPSGGTWKAGWCRSITMGSLCRNCLSAASRIPAMAPKAAPRRSKPISTRGSSHR